jgi:hypothetical protein
MKTTLTCLVFAISLGLVGCGGGYITSGGGGGSMPSSGSVAAGTFLINNQTSGTICYAMFSPASDPNWGPDQLGSNVITAGSSYSWTVGLGVWDVKLEDCDHNALLERRSVDIQGAGTILTVTD